MQILTDYSRALIIDSLENPMVTTYHWILSGHIKDFMLEQIQYLEETKGPGVEIMIEGLSFIVPASWNILVVDDETSTLDTIPIPDCATTNHKALLMSSVDFRIRKAPIKFVEFHEFSKCIHPSVAKGTMFCHPIGPELRNDKVENILSVMIGPYDLYSKYLKGIAAAELMY